MMMVMVNKKKMMVMVMVRMMIKMMIMVIMMEALLALRLRTGRVGAVRCAPQRAEENGGETPKGQHVPIDAASYIPVPPEVLREKLGGRLPGQSEAVSGEWNDFCDQLSEQIRRELRALRMNLKDAYQPFDPVRRRWVGSWPLPEKEVRFAQEFLRAASLAGFTPSLPVTILWDRLDSRWIEAVFEEGFDSDNTLEALSDFGGYVLALKRGVAVELQSGLLLTQKLECLQSQWLLRIGRLMRAMLQKLTQLSVQVWTQLLWPTARGLAEELEDKSGSNSRVQRAWRSPLGFVESYDSSDEAP
ncbi:hypothetical protein AK812_SmicGene1474 [Symbiodinium microadriaticum]|uniref:Uncharacterized protein n=1 Tax=Symbiodinium microadriaticum TaxID=2951 RepID=A0A1Q9F3V5_SYMMI|nr:hypothetical protein AK812_SmicGene1474 [Symbiodinium microadriaticum]